MAEMPNALKSRVLPTNRSLETLETPAVLVDVDVADSNLARWQVRTCLAGLANRPHIKTHRTIGWTLRQIELGAVGITCQTVGEGEVMAGAGIADVFLTTNTLGPAKLARLGALAGRCKLSIVADSAYVVDAAAGAARDAGSEITVFIECDTGGHRCGLSDPTGIAALARHIASSDHLRFGGLMTYPAAGKRAESEAALNAAIAACGEVGIDIPVVTSGGTPDMWKDEGLNPVTEYRAGTYIYNDRSIVATGAATIDECALTVLTTIVSCPAPGRVILDAGSKALTSDLLGQKGYGTILQYPEAVIYQLNEEHGLVDVTACRTPPRLGERVNVLPNHACVVSNLFDRINLVSEGELVGTLPVDARGKSA